MNRKEFLKTLVSLAAGLVAAPIESISKVFKSEPIEVEASRDVDGARSGIAIGKLQEADNKSKSWLSEALNHPRFQELLTEQKHAAICLYEMGYIDAEQLVKTLQLRIGKNNG